MTSKKTNHPKLKHDALFKKFFETKTAPREFLSQYLSTECLELIDLDKKIELDKDSFIEEELTRRFSDVLLKVATNSGDNGYVYCLLEHQNTADKTMPLRLWRYITLIMQRHIDVQKKEQKPKTKIPLIIPIVVHAGEHKYSPPRNLWQMFDHPQMAKKYLTEDYAVVDLSQISNDELKQKAHLGAMEFFLKNAKRRDLFKVWEEFMQGFPELIAIDRENGYIYIRWFLWYCDSKVPAEKKRELHDLIVDNLPTGEGEKVMQTIADTYIEQGMQRGFAKGIKQGIEQGIEQEKIANARRMLELGVDHNIVAGATNLSLFEVKKLAATIRIKK